MNNSELNNLLKSVPVPARPDSYWDRFPHRVLTAVRRPHQEEVARQRWFPRLAWGLAAASVCVLLGFAIGHWRGRVETSTAANSTLQNPRVIREMLDMFPERLRAIVQDEQGLHLVLADQATVPASIPIWVKVCQRDRCVTLVTFSGQELQLAGQAVTVLSDSAGGVIVLGDRFAWASHQPGQLPADLKIEARTLPLLAAR